MFCKALKRKNLENIIVYDVLSDCLKGFSKPSKSKVKKTLYFTTFYKAFTKAVQAKT